MTLPFKEHAALPPSSAHRWVFCNGWRALAARYPESEDTDAAKEGTAAHWCFEMLFAGHEIEVGAEAPNGVLVTDEMIDGAHLYADTVRAAVGEAVLFVEQRVTMERTIHPDNFGTPDTYAFTDALYLFDYKFGHAYVDPFENWQLINYAAGIYEKHGANWPAETRVVMIIVQPRHFCREGPVRQWVTTLGELLPYWKQLNVAAMLASGDETECMVGTYCDHCTGRHACEALQRYTLNRVEDCYSSLPLELPVLAASRELLALQMASKMLDARITGLEEMLLTDLKKGGTNPYYMIERAQGRQRWTKPVATIIALGKLLGIDVSKPGVITPKQAIDKGLPKEVVNINSDVPIGEWKLKPVDLKSSRKAFSNQ